jgi:hypothetical protein
MDNYKKYLKYKNKYLMLKKQKGGMDNDSIIKAFQKYPKMSERIKDIKYVV